MDNKIEPFGRMNSTPIFGKPCVDLSDNEFVAR